MAGRLFIGGYSIRPSMSDHRMLLSVYFMIKTREASFRRLTSFRYLERRSLTD